MKRSLTEIYLIVIVILAGLFASFDIGRRVTDWCEFVSNAPAKEQIAVGVIKPENENNNVVPLAEKQDSYPELESISGSEQLHDLDKYALQRVLSIDNKSFEKQTIYTIIGNQGINVSPINAAQIENVWNPPMDKPSNVKVIFTVMDDGTLKDVMLASSSGIPDADNAALSAVNNAKVTPFKIHNKHFIDVAMWFQVGNFKSK